ncbi:hypothetical protein ACQEU6_19320 [Spirillospora sp. CA-108201]
MVEASVASFPVKADHWHVSTTRNGVYEIFPERIDRATAVKTVRDMLIHDGNRTRDRRYVEAVRVIDNGWHTCQVNRVLYAAFACACPPSMNKERSPQWNL